jgi:hypothetical protein
VWSLALETQSTADMERAADASKPHARRLAAAIFAPAADWRAEASRDWQISTARLRAALCRGRIAAQPGARAARGLGAGALARMEDAGASRRGRVCLAGGPAARLPGPDRPAAGDRRPRPVAAQQPSRPPATTQDDQARQPRYRPYF